MKQKNILIYIGLVFALVYKSYCFRCSMIPDDVVKGRNINDIDRYIIDIPGNPKSYNPGHQYNVTLRSNPHALIPRTFKRFIITLEPFVDGTSIISNKATGQFAFSSNMLTRFSERCANTVVEMNTLPKTEIELFWHAPPPNSGCVVMKATVIESRDNWFSEDGGLTKVLCEESEEDENVQPDILSHCCACDEAKYEVEFEGLWTRNTHPRDFPSDVWSTKFSDVVGASHKLNHAFWNYAGIASDGLKELAETGETRTLETELKDNTENIRTIIKARGLQYPNLTDSTFAVFRVDNQNHLVSLVSKISPSPDWIVGVSNWELCKIDCSWEESRVLLLYPWDVGTDDGYTYTSPDEPSPTKNPIRRIRANSPNDPRSPFYDENGEDMKPIAKIRVTRQKLYEKQCDESNQPNENNEECAVSEWYEWSPCSKACGKGNMFRQRHLLNPANADTCTVRLVEVQECFGQSKNCEQSAYEAEPLDLDDFRCELAEWGEWSSCSATCGKGTRTRDRKYKNPDYESLCKRDISELQENEECDGKGEDCNDEEIQNDCPDTTWGEWSRCNVTCGMGYKTRVLLPNKDYEDNEDESKNNCANSETVECYEEPCDSEETNSHLFGNINSGNHLHIVHQGSDGPVINCKVTKWSTWSRCDLNGQDCGEGYKTRIRQIKVHPMNGGVACPKNLIKTKKCNVPCQEEKDGQDDRIASAEIPQNIDITKCIMTSWTAWSPCSSICGDSAVQQRTRSVLLNLYGAPCPSRIEQRKCDLPAACTNKGLPIF